MAREKVHFQGLPARICWLGYGERARPALHLQRPGRSGKVTAPIVIGRDHLDCGSVACPYRETESDGTAPTPSPTGRCSTRWSTRPPAPAGSASTTAAAWASARASTPAWSSSPTARDMAGGAATRPHHRPGHGRHAARRRRVRPEAVEVEQRVWWPGPWQASEVRGALAAAEPIGRDPDPVATGESCTLADAEGRAGVAREPSDSAMRVSTTATQLWAWWRRGAAGRRRHRQPPDRVPDGGRTTTRSGRGSGGRRGGAEGQGPRSRSGRGHCGFTEEEGAVSGARPWEPPDHGLTDLLPPVRCATTTESRWPRR